MEPVIAWLLALAAVLMALRTLWRRYRRLRGTIGQATGGGRRRTGSRRRGGARAREERPPAPRPADARWIGPDDAARIGDVTIRGGLFYLGGALPTVDGRREEPCLIDPDATLGAPPGNRSGQGVPAVPAYAELTPAARRGFVEFLAGGRADPATPVGYLLLYLYGLERRLFLEGVARDLPRLTAEVRRLSGLPGDKAPFGRFARAFLDAATLMAGDVPERPALSPERPGGELSVALRGAIGRLLRRGERLDADWMLAWYLGHPEKRLRTAAARCFAEFTALFRRRFAARWPQGLEVRAPRRRLAMTYKAASGTFAVPVRGAFEGWPDIVALTGPLEEIEPLVAAVTANLEPYSRLVGRDAATRGTLAAALLLPPELADEPAAAPIAALRRWLETRVPAEGEAVLPAAELAAQAGLRAAGRAEAASLAATLDRAGFGMEPDARFGTAVPAALTDIVLFRSHTPADPAAPAFVAARTQLEIGTLVGAADGTLAAAEVAMLGDEVRGNAGLDEAGRRRLLAHLAWLARNPPPVRLLGRFRDRPEEQRRMVARVAAAAAAADGSLSVEEVRLLERIYKTLGLATGDLYGELQGFGARGATAERPPDPTAAGPEPLLLDRARLDRIRADTARVSAILTEVFAEEAPPVPPEPPEPAVPEAAEAPAAAPPPAFDGLEARHARLLGRLATLDEVARGDFTAWAREEGLLPDGAIETINDWAFDRYGEPVLDDGEPVEIAHHLLRASGTTGD